MCRNCSSEKNLSLIDSGRMKLRTSVPRNTGSASNHSATCTTVYCASRSHGSM
ncbi:MAG: hypothetical protein LKCHEGNO_03482 [Burkholderiaceae bacterium]|nr:hypothetical protein [Burkholderiaceae bacterium]